MEEAPPAGEGEQVPREAEEPQNEEVQQDSAGKPDEAAAGGGEAPDDAAAEAPEGERRERGGKTLEQQMSLKEGDDERTQISKKVSWILRHGARKVSIEIDSDGWVTFDDLLAHSIMAGVTEEKL